MDTEIEATARAARTTADDVVTACYAEQAPTLERYVRSLVRDPDEAADVCQEVFVRLLTAGREGRLPDVPAAWIRRVAHNIVVSGARHRQVGDRVLGRLADDDALPSTEDTVLRHERDRFVVRALAAIASDDRTAILLAAQGYRTGEISRQIGRTELATKTLLCRARGRLRTQLKALEPA